MGFSRISAVFLDSLFTQKPVFCRAAIERHLNKAIFVFFKAKNRRFLMARVRIIFRAKPSKAGNFRPAPADHHGARGGGQ